MLEKKSKCSCAGGLHLLDRTVEIKYKAIQSEFIFTGSQRAGPAVAVELLKLNILPLCQLLLYFYFYIQSQMNVFQITLKNILKNEINISLKTKIKVTSVKKKKLLKFDAIPQ